MGSEQSAALAEHAIGAHAAINDDTDAPVCTENSPVHLPHTTLLPGWKGGSLDSTEPQLFAVSLQEKRRRIDEQNDGNCEPQAPRSSAASVQVCMYDVCIG